MRDIFLPQPPDSALHWAFTASVSGLPAFPDGRFGLRFPVLAKSILQLRAEFTAPVLDVLLFPKVSGCFVTCSHLPLQPELALQRFPASAAVLPYLGSGPVALVHHPLVASFPCSPRRFAWKTYAAQAKPLPSAARMNQPAHETFLSIWGGLFCLFQTPACIFVSALSAAVRLFAFVDDDGQAWSYL